MNFQEEKAYIGHLDQLFSIKQYVLSGGRSEGVKAVSVSNGSGLDFTVLLDRCMDFYQICINGKSLNYLSPTGVVSPKFYDNSGTNWLQSFYVGFLTTCGLSNIGIPSIENGEPLPMHGNMANTPAENVSITTELVDGTPAVCISGTMREAKLFGSNLTLTRKIICKYGVNQIEFCDTVENHGFKTSELVLLYHFNMGYPLLNENAELNIPTNRVTPRDAHAKSDEKNWRVITPPADDYTEKCYYHDIVANEGNLAKVGVKNPKNNLSAEIEYSKTNLDHFVQWKMLGKGEYVMGFEPCNSTLDGRQKARENGDLKFIQPGQVLQYPFKLKF